MEVLVYQINAFSLNNKGGNPAGVVLDEYDLTEEQMNKIAKEVGFSETSFIRRTTDELSIRFFTPEEEVDLCGHATLASFFLLKEKGLFKKETSFTCKAGRIRVYEEESAIFLEQTKPVFFDEKISKERLSDIFSLSAEDLEVDDLHTPRMVSTGLIDVIVPIKDVETLKDMEVDMEALSEYSKELGAIGAHAFSIDKEIYVRNFAPAVGIDEESATGTANAALASYLYKEKGLKGKEKFSFYQGQWMNSPSLIKVILDEEAIFVGGEAYFREEKIREVIL